MFNDVMKAVHQWYRIISEKYLKSIMFEIDRDNESAFIVNLETKRYIAQLTVENCGFHPYRYVSFYVLDTEKDESQQSPFVYYDSENASISDIVENLNLGVDFIIKADKS